MPPSPDANQLEKSPPSDTTRNHLANERTLLAWARTGLAVMGLGFIVARFGLALRELNQGRAVYHHNGLAMPFGVLLIMGGVALLILAGQRYVANGRAIERQQFHWTPITGIVLTGLLVLVGILLVIYLIVSV